MRPKKRGKLIRLESSAPAAGAKVYDLTMRKTASRYQRRIRDLQHENALLTRILSETQIEIGRLRGFLAEL
jgi:hypothetical protein